MKKYTIIYAETFQHGSHQSSITKMKYIECEESEFNLTVDMEVGWTSVWFVLDGHCKQVGD